MFNSYHFVGHDLNRHIPLNQFQLLDIYQAKSYFCE